MKAEAVANDVQTRLGVHAKIPGAAFQVKGEVSFRNERTLIFSQPEHPLFTLFRKIILYGLRTCKATQKILFTVFSHSQATNNRSE